MKRPTLLTVVLILAAAALISCGTSGGPSKSIRVTMTDFAFSPKSFTVPAGQEIQLEVTNTGAVQHSFIIMKAGHPAEGHFSEADKANVYWEQAVIPAGESIKDTFTAPSEPGEYQVVCGIAGHFEAGMVAKLIVVQQP